MAGAGPHPAHPQALSTLMEDGASLFTPSISGVSNDLHPFSDTERR